MSSPKNNPKLSPMMRRYFEIKQNYEDAILLFRLGDFYEMFFDDAIKASKALDLTLTGRDCGLSERAPMCGVPYHAVDSYIRKLIEQGFRVAICEQLEDPKTAKGLVDRDVVRVITKGTIMEDTILDEKSSNYLASVYLEEQGFGIAWTDISTGEFCIFEDDDVSNIDSILSAVSPSETVCGFSNYKQVNTLAFFNQNDNVLRAVLDSAFKFDNACGSLMEQYKVCTLKSFECEDKSFAVRAAGGLLEYLKETQKRILSQLRTVKLVKNNSFMVLDGNTKRNLELVQRAKDGKRNGSLLSVLDKCETNMGSRYLKRLIEQPLQNLDEIKARQAATACLYENISKNEALKEYLAQVSDLERLTAKIAYGSVSPKHCIAIKTTLKAIPHIKQVLSDCGSQFLESQANSLDSLDYIADLIDRAIDENKAGNKDGGFIADSYNEELKNLRHIKESAKIWLSNLEAEEREQTGIKTLRVGYNRIFGYYIEVSKSFADKVPYTYQRKQTLTTGERFITPELKEIEEKILTADEKAIRLETQLYSEIKEELLKVVPNLQTNALALAQIDISNSLATVASLNKYCRPSFVENGNVIEIKNGRHPVVEKVSGGLDYIPNDTYLNGEDSRTMIITGPNMAGKSTYMRQVALIVLMAHIGSFVPADSAKISVVDRIFTRIGASDDLSSGQSTFMVEMIEVATILNNATSKSLILLDEIGRGTSTIDGLSIAWAVMEEINDNVKANTLFATHFHELAALNKVEGIKIYKVLVKELNDTVLFLHKIAEGGANKSFGIEVAQIAGVPRKVVEKAKAVMRSIENGDTKFEAAPPDSQISQNQYFEVIEALKDIDVNNCTPVNALLLLTDLVKKVSE